MLIPSTVNPASKTIITSAKGSFGRFFRINLKCGWHKTSSTQNTAKYIIYGVKIEQSIASANIKLYIGLGRFSPWIFEPSQSSNVGQNTSIIKGVPEPARNRNGVDRIIKQDASKDTLFLNQRFRSRINRNPNTNPAKILGSLIANGVKPNITIDSF